MEIHTQDEYETALRLRKNVLGGLLLVGNDMETEGEWVWNSNETMVNINEFWKKWCPRISRTKNCLALSKHGMWDTDCAYTKSSFCEFNEIKLK